MIHPQYIVSLVDFGSGKFIIRNINNIYKFEFNIYCKDIKILYKIKDRFKIGKIIINRVTEFVDKSMLSIGDKEALKNELILDAPAVASALLEHFNSTGIVWEDAMQGFKEI